MIPKWLIALTQWLSKVEVAIDLYLGMHAAEVRRRLDAYIGGEQ